jgi:REP element-mobilizing transposase RayT
MASHERPIPMAYFITFGCYGARLHGDERGSVDRAHCIPGTPLIPLDAQRVEDETAAMEQPPYALDEPRRVCVLTTLMEVSRHRQWRLMAAHVREHHVHVVVAACDAPEKIMSTFKAYASRRLSEAGHDSCGRKRWSRHGSTRYLWDLKGLQDAVHYVVSEQGPPMQVYDCRADDGGGC